MLGVGDETTYLGHLGTMGELNVGMGSVLVIHWFLDPDFMRPLAARGLWHEAVYRARHQL